MFTFLSTLPVRGATPALRCPLHPVVFISIHAPREGSDALPIVQTLFGSKFLSTLPVRGATFHQLSAGTAKRYFYPRSP